MGEITLRVNDERREIELVLDDEILGAWTFDDAFDKAIWIIQATGELAIRARAER